MISNVSDISDVRDAFVSAAESAGENDTVELIGVSFIADEETIFGKVNRSYVQRELEWYDSLSLNVNDIPGGPPPIWKQVSDDDGFINSNYGFLVYSEENHSQYAQVHLALARDKDTRQATMVYTRPTIHTDSKWNNRSDFICTNTVQYFIRDEKLEVVVQMRSNDAVFGYRNDYAWQREVQRRLHFDLVRQYPTLSIGPITWQVANLHVYPRHRHLIDTYAKTGEYDVEV